MKHTQLPWVIKKYKSDTDIETKTGLSICGLFAISQQPVEANAEFIVRACNNFEALLNTAKGLLADALDRNECHDEDTGLWFRDWKALSDVIDKCEGR